MKRLDLVQAGLGLFGWMPTAALPIFLPLTDGVGKRLDENQKF